GEEGGGEVGGVGGGGGGGGRGRPLGGSRRWDQPKPSVWSVMIVMADVDAEHALEMRPIPDEEPVETLRPHRPDPALRVGVGSGGPHRRAENPDGLAPEHLIKRSGELVVAVAHEEPHPALGIGALPREIPRLLGDPAAAG